MHCLNIFLLFWFILGIHILSSELHYYIYKWGSLLWNEYTSFLLGQLVQIIQIIVCFWGFVIPYNFSDTNRCFTIVNSVQLYETILAYNYFFQVKFSSLPFSSLLIWVSFLWVGRDRNLNCLFAIVDLAEEEFESVE